MQPSSFELIKVCNAQAAHVLQSICGENNNLKSISTTPLVKSLFANSPTMEAVDMAPDALLRPHRIL